MASMRRWRDSAARQRKSGSSSAERGDVLELFVLFVLAVLGVEAAEFKAAQFADELLQLLKLQSPWPSAISCSAGARPRRWARIAGGLGDGACLATQLARAPVERAQPVQDGAANAELCVALELDVAARVEAIAGFHQTDHAGGDEIVELDVARQRLVELARDEAD